MSVTVKRPRDGAIARQFSAAVRAGAAAAAEHWHAAMMPLHFTSGAAARYGYAPRTAAYMRRKARRMRHQRGLEYSGHAKDQARNDAIVRGTTIVGRPAAVVTMRMPAYFVKHPTGGGRHIDKPAELTRTTPDEQQTLAAIVARVSAQRMGVELPSLAANVA